MGLSPHLKVTIESQIKRYVARKTEAAGMEKVIVWQTMLLHDTLDCDVVNVRLLLNDKLGGTSFDNDRLAILIETCRLQVEEAASIKGDEAGDLEATEDEDDDEGSYYYRETRTADFTESSSRLPIVVCIRDEHNIENELEKNPWSLPYLVRENSKEAVATRSGREFLKVQINTTGSYRPKALSKKPKAEDYANLTIRIEGGERDKSLTLRFNGHHKKRHIPRHASVVFQLGSDDETNCQSAIATVVLVHGKDTDQDGWVVNNSNPSKPKWEAELRIIYRRVIVAGVGNTDGFDEDVRKTIAALGTIEDPEPGELAKLDIKVHCWHEDRKIFLSNIVKVLQLPKAVDPDWAAYRINGMRDFPYVRERMRTRQQVWEHEQALVKVPQRDYYTSPEVAVSMQMYGLLNEVLYEEARHEGFKAAIHSVGFQYAGAPGHGYAFIRADVETLRPSKVHDRVQMPRNNESLTICFNHDEKLRKLSGVMVPNFRQAVDATFVLHIDVVPHDFGDYASMPDEMPDFQNCSLLVNKGRDLGSIGHALKSFYTNDMYKNFQEVFMGQRLDRIEPLDPTAGITGLSQEDKDRFLAEALKLENLNDQQTAVILKAFSLPGGVLNIQGPAGVGKTLVLAILAWLYTKCGMSVVLLSKTHPATRFTDKQFEFLADYLDVLPPLYGVDGKSTNEAALWDHQEQKLHLRLLSVVNASDQVTPSGSKVNEMYLDFYVMLVTDMFIKTDLFDASEWCYITPYAAQLKRVKEKIVTLLEDFGLPVECVPQMAIADSAMGLEFKHVIYDIVTSEKSGFLKEDGKVITHATRGMNALWVIGSQSVLSADESAAMDRAANSKDKRGYAHDKRPVLFQVFTVLKESKLVSHFHIP